MYTPLETVEIAIAVMKDVKKRWGWEIFFDVELDGRFHWYKISGEDRYDMYPGMTKEEADAAVISEIEEIIHRYMPYASVTEYEQSGRSVRRG